MVAFTRRIKYLALAVVVVLATSVSFAGRVPAAHAQLFGMSEQEEIRIGREVQSQLAIKPGFVHDPAQTKYVAHIGLQLARVSERPNLPWTYRILNDSQVNALAAPGGYVFVTSGLLRFVKSDNELAFVLGHETTHIAHRHAVDLAQRQLELQLGAALITQVLFGGNLTAYQLSQVAGALIGAQYSREKEYEADHFGVIFARKAGFDPTASLAFFERLQALEQKQGALGSAFASHPPTPDRIKAIHDELRQMGYQVAGPTAPAFPSSDEPRHATTGPAALPPPSPPSPLGPSNR